MSYILFSDICELHRRLTSMLKHPAQIYSQVRVALFKHFNKPLIIDAIFEYKKLKLIEVDEK